MPLRLLLLLVTFALAACADSASTPDTQAKTDTAMPGWPPDTNWTQPTNPGADTHTSVDMHSPQDTGPLPAGKNTAWGVIAGACGVLGAEITSQSPGYFENTYHFANAAFFDPTNLAKGPQNRFSGGNSGGSSICSEVMSMQVLVDCDDASVYKTEGEIIYTQEGSKADYVALLNFAKVGVSVTRAYLGPNNDQYSVEQARSLLEKKLDKMNKSAAIVSPADGWVKQIIHLWTLKPAWAALVKQGWDLVDPGLKGSTILLVTIEQGSTMIVTDTCDD
jgi:hypothetical protein